MKLSADLLRLVLLVAVTLGVAGCGGSQDAEEGHGHGGHGHEPKYGGQLVELGHHEGNLEIVVDAAAGKLTAYVLDAHAENFVRLPLESIAVVVVAAEGEKTLALKPVGNPATGEKPGDTSQFEGTADWLKNVASFKATVRELPVKSKTFQNVQFSWPH